MGDPTCERVTQENLTPPKQKYICLEFIRPIHAQSHCVKHAVQQTVKSKDYFLSQQAEAEPKKIPGENDMLIFVTMLIVILARFEVRSHRRLFTSGDGCWLPIRRSVWAGYSWDIRGPAAGISQTPTWGTKEHNKGEVLKETKKRSEKVSNKGKSRELNTVTSLKSDSTTVQGLLGKGVWCQWEGEWGTHFQVSCAYCPCSPLLLLRMLRECATADGKRKGRLYAERRRDSAEREGLESLSEALFENNFVCRKVNRNTK